MTETTRESITVTVAARSTEDLAAPRLTVVQALAKAKMLPTKFVLEQLDIPQSGEMAEEALRELELASLARIKKPR